MLLQDTKTRLSTHISELEQELKRFECSISFEGYVKQIRTRTQPNVCYFVLFSMLYLSTSIMYFYSVMNHFQTLFQTSLSGKLF